MRIAAICPTFRRPKLIPGIVHMFQQQTHADKVLLILDDGGSFDLQFQACSSGDDDLSGVFVTSTSRASWILHSVPRRYETVWHKFNDLIDLAESGGADAIALMEDDDCYLPGYLEAHARALETAPWSASPRVWFREPNHEPRIEPAMRRFHGGWAYTLDAIREVGGYPTKPYGSDTGLSDRLWNKFGRPADPWPDGSPQYVYRWQTSGYCNAHGWGENMHQAMANDHKPHRIEGPIVPGLDALQALHLNEVEPANLPS